MGDHGAPFRGPRLFRRPLDKLPTPKPRVCATDGIARGCTSKAKAPRSKGSEGCAWQARPSLGRASASAARLVVPGKLTSRRILRSLRHTGRMCRRGPERGGRQDRQSGEGRGTACRIAPSRDFHDRTWGIPWLGVFVYLTALSLLGERVGRPRRFLQPGRAGPSPAAGSWTLWGHSPLQPAGG
jgi:hypothetical protein